MLIKYLLQKLKTGDTRSINLNAIPGRLATRLDIHDLKHIDEELVNIFFGKLLTEASFKINIDLGSIETHDEEDGNLNQKKLFNTGETRKVSKKKWGIILKKINTIISREEEEFQEHGVKSFGFGYPLLVKKIPKDIGKDKIMIAPIFIWKLSIQRLKSSKYTYEISRNDEMGLGLNEVLLGNLETNDKIIIKQLGEDILDDGIIDNKELLDNLNSLLSKCGSKEFYNNIQEIQKIGSSKKELEEYYETQGGEKSTIFRGGVFGLYKTLKEKIIEDTKKLPNEEMDESNNEEYDFKYEHPYGCVNTDPSQQKVIDNLAEKEGMVIQGPPGTGKSQTITAIITNALDNDKKCLVVCEKKTALEVIKDNLSKIGLGDICALIEDVNRERKDIVGFVREKQEHGFTNPGFKSNEYNSVISDIDTLIKKDNLRRELLTNDYFNNTNRKTLVGKYLYKSRNVDKEVLETIYEKISNRFKNSKYETFDKLIKIVKKGEELSFEGVNTLFLNQFKTSFFTEEGSYLSCKNKFDKFRKEVSEQKAKLEESIKSFENKIDKNKELHKINNDSNNLIKSKFTQNGIQGAYIETLIDKLKKAGDEKLLLEINLIIKNHFIQTVKSSEKIYDIFLNPQRIKLDIEKYKTKILKSESYHKSIRNINSLLIEKIKYIIGKAEEISGLAESLLSKYNDANNIGGVYNLKNNLFGFFSQKHNQIKKIHTDIYNSYIELKMFANNEGLANITEGIIEYKKYNTLTELQNQLTIVKKICNKCDLKSIDNKGLETIIYDKDIDSNRKGMIQQIEKLNTLIGEHLKAHSSKKIESFADIYNQIEEYKEIVNNLNKSSNKVEEFYDRTEFYYELSKKEKKIIDIFLINSFPNRDNLFEVIRLKYLLLNNDTNKLPKSDNDILKLHGLVKDLKTHQIKGIKDNRQNKAKQSINELKNKGITIQSLYNKKGPKGKRRNSLRKIIATDFDLFSNIFPVVLVSPQVCASILPLEKNLFDIVLFDEASQIRLEEVMSAMYRGKQKIICGDQHQMPPSNHFASSNILIEANDDEIQNNEDDKSIKFTGSDMATQLANSESLLDYAEKKGYFQYMLKIHYRSEHHVLIDFSNHAFYGGRLQALPNRYEYNPISFHKVEGVFEKGINEKEALKVIDLLQSILSDENITQKYDGKIPSIGIATFNMYQKDYIWELIQKIKYENTLPEIAKKIDQVDLFVKNLDSIQGDERDIIIISTTFGRKSDGSFRQNYGQINHDKGYRLLNVMITRAKKKIHLITSIPSEIYTKFEERLRYSNSEMKHGGSLLHAYINYCKAVHEENESQRLSILEKIGGSRTYSNQEEGLTESPFEEEVLHSLCEIIDPNRIKLQHNVGGFRIDMVILSKLDNKPLIAIECDGATYHSGDIAYCNDIFRQDILEGFGFTFHRIRSTNWWRDRKKEEDKIRSFLEGLNEI